MKPALLGGDPAFPEGLPISRPFRPPFEAVVERLRPSYEAGQLTNGPLLATLEEELCKRLGVRHVVALGSCTAGLLLTVRALPIEGPVVLPSFTFSATALAPVWNGLPPRFVECDPATLQIDVADLAGHLDGAGMVMATHVNGAPCDVEGVVEAAGTGMPVVFDSAHALGAAHLGRPVGGFGTAEVFSLSPTKPVIAGEGGIVATDDGGLAEQLRWGRNYGDPGDYDTRFPGLNARMSELHAALALESLALLDEHLARRRALAESYRTALAGVPGVRVQTVSPGDEPTWKFFTVAVDRGELGLDRDTLVAALRAEGVDTRCYFDPPVHRQQAFSHFADRPLPVTDAMAGAVLSLPLHTEMDAADAERVVEVIESARRHAGELAAGVAPVS